MGIRLLSAVRLMALAAACVWSACAFAANEAQVNMTTAPASAADSTAALSDQVKMSDNGMVSLDFQDADIRNVLKVLAFKSGLNIVAAPDVTGVVTIQLTDVPWQKALDVILSTYGYGYERRGNIISVMTIANLKKYREDVIDLQAQEPLSSKTFVLSFSKAADVLKIIDKMKSSRGFINSDERTNAIIVRDLENNLELISGVIKTLDTVTPQVLIETKVIETDLMNTENLGIDWVIQASGSGAARPTTFPFVQNSGIFGQQGAAYVPPSTTSFALSPAAAANFTYGTINASQFSATLEVLSSRSNTRILSSPRVVTLNNQQAIVNVGVEYPLANYTFNANTGQQEINGFTYKPIGINFEVTPHVNNAGLITMDLHPSITAILQPVTVANTSIPEISNQETQTKVMVENNKTLVIAGLITDQKIVTKTKVPLLGDIPFLGELLFKKTDTTIKRTELLIFMTPHIITVDKRSN